jgi:tetratricopeptide (TPR) repeat protein
MNGKTLVIGAALAALGMAAWLGWRWHTTPVPPQLALESAEPAVAKAVEAARLEVLAQPRSGAAWGGFAMTLIANGFREEALSCLSHAEQFDPKNPRWPYFRGIQLHLTRPKTGITSIERALVLAETPAQRAAIQFRLGLFLIEAGRLDEAEPHVQALTQIEPDSPRLHFLHGLMAMAREDRAAARMHLATLTENPFARERACNLLASLADGDHEMTRAYQKKAAQAPPDIPWPDPIMTELAPLAKQRATRFTEIRGLASQRRFAEAIEKLQKLASESSDLESCNKLAEVFFDLGEYAAAEEILHTVIQVDAADLEAQFRLGQCLLKRAEQRLQEPDGKASAFAMLREAVKAADVVLAVHRNQGNAHLLRGRALRRLGQTEECLRALRQAVLCRPEFAEAYVELGEALAEAGQLREALEHLEDAVRLAGPDDPRPRKVLQQWRAKVKPSS